MRQLLYEGKGKKVYQDPESKDQVILFFKDDLTAYQAKKKGSFKRKGEVCKTVSALIFKYLEKKGVKTHLIEEISPREIRCFKTEIFPLEVVIRNRLAGSTAKRLGLKEGQSIEDVLLEFYYKRDDLDDPFISEEQILHLNLIKETHWLEPIKKQAFFINETLKVFFEKAGLELVDFKMEFGLLKQIDQSTGGQAKAGQDKTEQSVQKSQLLLADEISPDSCRIWDQKTGERLDKDRFRREWGQVGESYQKIEELLLKAWGDLS